jgi:ketosteroid isomerase-like protein
MDFEHGKAVVSRFNDCVNAGDIEGLSRAMTDDHVFIDAADKRVSGKPACLRAWQDFFATFPDYRNDFAQFVAREGLVVVIGRSSCSDRRLDGPGYEAIVYPSGASLRTMHRTGTFWACMT